MNIEEPKEELTNLKKTIVRLAEQGLVVQGHRNNNGADYYKCSVCHAETEVNGYADIMGSPIDDVVHEKDCEFNNLYLQFKAEFESEEE